MLNRNSMSPRAPIVTEKLVTVRIKKPLYVAGKACEVGSLASMTLSDAEALKNSSPPAIEFI